MFLKYYLYIYWVSSKMRYKIDPEITFQVENNYANIGNAI